MIINLSNLLASLERYISGAYVVEVIDNHFVMALIGINILKSSTNLYVLPLKKPKIIGCAIANKHQIDHSAMVHI